MKLVAIFFVLFLAACGPEEERPPVNDQGFRTDCMDECEVGETKCGEVVNTVLIIDQIGFLCVLSPKTVCNKWLPAFCNSCKDPVKGCIPDPIEQRYCSDECSKRYYQSRSRCISQYSARQKVEQYTRTDLAIYADLESFGEDAIMILDKDPSCKQGDPIEKEAPDRKASQLCPDTNACGCSNVNKSKCGGSCCVWTVGSGCGCK